MSIVELAGDEFACREGDDDARALHDDQLGVVDRAGVEVVHDAVKELGDVIVTNLAKALITFHEGDKVIVVYVYHQCDITEGHELVDTKACSNAVDR